MSSTADSIDVRITGDGSGASAAMEKVGAAVASAVGVMADRLSALGLISRDAMATVGESSTKAAADVEKSDTIIGAATERMRLHFMGVTENVEIMRSKFEVATGAIEFFNKALIGVGAILAGGALFKESIGAAVNLTTETNRLASAYGITLAQASGLHEALHTLGIETDTATNLAMKLSRQVKAHEDALNADGIATRNAAGEQLNLLQIQQNTIDRLHEMEPGLQRNKVAIDAFGRGTGDLTVLMRLNGDAMKEGMETAKALGIVVGKDGVDSVVAYQHSVAEAKSVMEALWVAIGQALIPVVRELADMLKNNGASAVQTMRSAIEGLINTIRLVVAAFATIDIAISGVAAAVAGFASLIATTGRIVADVFTLNWGAIANDWKVGLANLDKIAKDANTQIAADWATSNMGWVGGGKPGAAGAGDEANPDTGDQAPDKEKKAKEPVSRVPEFENQLAELKLSLDKQNDAENTFHEMSKQAEADYWAAILQRTDLSAKEKTEVERKYLDASLAAKQANFNAMIAKEQEELAAAKGNGDARIALAQKIAAQMAQAYGKDSTQAQSALKEVTRVTQEEATKQAKIAADLAAQVETAQLGVVNAAEAAAKHRTEMGLQTEQQLLAQERDLENQRYAILVAGIAARAQAALLDPTTSKEAVAKLNKELEALDVAHQAALTKNTQQGELQRTQIARTAESATVNLWSQSLAKLVTLQQGFASTLQGLYQGLQSIIGNALSAIISKMVTDWLTAHGVMAAIDKLFGINVVANSAAQAGAGGTASMAAAPFPLNLTAPAYGASMAAAAASFGSLLTASGGFDIPAGMNPLTQLHEKEMVLPAKHADVIRGLADGGGGAGGGHTFQYHDHTGRATSEDIARNTRTFAKTMRKAWRNGSR